ncbi:hypothetical protein OIU84_028372 [Salix udensis]|uniref:Uncharacterized protein n=1 Tax=Salix udensis TaxID=889485 RepID=A0AAD6KCE0_9ROSI|nr:hypothetical protein OIU84_028372 [Salix udensis]
MPTNKDVDLVGNQGVHKSLLLGLSSLRTTITITISTMRTTCLRSPIISRTL